MGCLCLQLGGYNESFTIYLIAYTMELFELIFSEWGQTQHVIKQLII